MEAHAEDDDGLPFPTVERLRDLIVRLGRADIPSARAELLAAAEPLLDDIETQLQELQQQEQAHRRTLEAGLADLSVAMSSIGALSFEDEVERTYDGGPFDVIAYLVNETGREVQNLVRELESTHELLLESTKMRALGTLACGVAHDFNNVLTVLMGLAGSLFQQLPADHWARPDLETMLGACERSRGLTRQLLAFARADASKATVFEPADVIMSVRTMLQQVVDGQAELSIDVPEERWSVEMDRTLFEQMLLNLVSNASKAIAEAGSVQIVVENIASDDDAPPNVPTPLVRVSVVDDGTGMTPDVRARVFEPFFTTRPTGEGTGLGLSTSQGAVRSVGGDIFVKSEPGGGSSFTVCLPRVETVPQAESNVAGSRDRPHRSAVVLVVDDDPDVRSVVARIVGSSGYTVHVADGGRQALELASQLEHPVDVLLTDIVMPDINGPKLAASLRERHPGTRVLFMSGYSDHPVHTLTSEDTAFIPKPFRTQALLDRLDTLVAKESR